MSEDVGATWTIPTEEWEPAPTLTVHVEGHEVTIPTIVEEVVHVPEHNEREIQDVEANNRVLERLPRSRQPPQKHGEWIYPINRNMRVQLSAQLISLMNQSHLKKL